MPKRLKIPQQVLKLHPNLTLNEIRTILKVILNSRAMRLRQANIVNINIPHIGRFRSHGLKKHKRTNSTMKRDKKRKKKEYKQNELKRDNLLF